MIFLNGNFVKTGAAKISVYDHGFLYGDGAFETLRVYKKHVFKFEEHIQRLYGSLKQIYMELSVAPQTILKAIKLLLQHNQLVDAYVRITITRGEGPIGTDISLCPQHTVLVVAEMAHTYPANWYSQGVSVIISRYRKIPDICIPASIKSCNYLSQVMARKEASDRKAQEGILLNLEGYVTEGISSNIFIVTRKKLLTPALSAGILDGITRRTVMELAEYRNIDVEERHIFPQEILAADECFLTNTSMEIMPVTFCDGTRIGKGQPGKMTRLLMKDYGKLVEQGVAKERQVT